MYYDKAKKKSQMWCVRHSNVIYLFEYVKLMKT